MKMMLNSMSQFHFLLCHFTINIRKNFCQILINATLTQILTYHRKHVFQIFFSME